MSNAAHWLDKIVAEQAAHYGLTVEQHANLMRGAAVYQESIDLYVVDEPETHPAVKKEPAT